MALVSQSIHPRAPPRRGDPSGEWSQARPANLSASLDAKRRETSSWSSPRMLTQNFPALRSFGQVDEPLPAQNPTSGGSSEIEKNEPMAMPTGVPSSNAATTETPVGKCPSTWRKRALSNAGSVIDGAPGGCGV